MHLSEGEFYHIYNRGNNKQVIFFNHANYLYFIQKTRQQLLPVCNIIAYCLMPNHFHLLIQANENTVKERNTFGGKPMQEFSYRTGILLSSYSQAINKEQHSSGSLFQQKTKAKILSETENGKSISYLEQCFFYIHQNPLTANLVDDLAKWPYSSYPGYTGLRNGTLCNKEILFAETGFHLNDITSKSKLSIKKRID
ncbi:MAG: transposase [Sphingobacteriales bacterium]|nr:transposase [Sphingobacteriales bacterium]